MSSSTGGPQAEGTTRKVSDSSCAQAYASSLKCELLGHVQPAESCQEWRGRGGASRWARPALRQPYSSLVGVARQTTAARCADAATIAPQPPPPPAAAAATTAALPLADAVAADAVALNTCRLGQEQRGQKKVRERVCCLQAVQEGAGALRVLRRRCGSSGRSTQASRQLQHHPQLVARRTQRPCAAGSEVRL